MPTENAATARNGVDTGALLALLGRQRDLSRQLSGLAQRQRTAIVSGDTRRLLEVLEQRRRLLDQLGELAERLRPHQADWAAVRQWLSAEERGQADGLLAEVNGLLSGIMKTDEEDAQLLAARKSATAQELGALKGGRAAGAAYAAAGTEPARMEWTD